MKKNSLILLFFLLSSFFSFAQSNTNNGLRVSLRAGMNINQMKSNIPIQGLTNSFGYHYGIALENRLSSTSELFFNGTGLIYSLKGYRQQLNPETIRVKLHYLSMPIYLGYRPTGFLSLRAGAELSLLLNTTISNDFGRDERFGKNFKKGDVALFAGINLLETKDINISIKYIHGMIPLVKGTYVDAQGNIDEFKDFKNRTVQISLLYTFAK